MTFQIESRPVEWGDWSPEGLGDEDDNEFETEEDAWVVAEQLRAIYASGGDEFEFRVVELTT